MRYSVGMKCDGDKEMSHEEILELADAVAIHSGIAMGIGQEAYGAKIIVDAENAREAELVAKEHFRAAVQQAGLPAWPISEVETLSEEDDLTPDR
jgi:hypothetical protein